MNKVLRNPIVLALSFGHMTTDILSSSVPVLLAAMAATMGLSNLAIGTIATFYIFSASLTQPLFGLAADRWDTRWVGVGGLLWQATGFAIAAWLPGNAAFVMLVLAALGSGAYHPQATMNTRRASGSHAAGGTSLFFFFGQSGHAVGPILAGFLLQFLPLTPAVLLLALVPLPAILLLLRYAPRGTQHVAKVTRGDGEERHKINWVPLTIMAFVLVLFFRGWPPQATSTFLPKWLADASFSPSEYGAMAGTFMFSSALGNICGGWLADRWSRKALVVLPLAFSVIPFYFLYREPSVGATAVAATAAAGFVVGMPHSVMVLMGQSLFPGRMGFGSGLVLGSMFTIGAVASWLTGWLASQMGLQQALQLVPIISLFSALFALALPRTRPQRQAAPAMVKAEG